MDFDEEPEESGSFSMTGFLFGNIDKEGKPDNDILDDESKRHLMELGALSGLSSLANQIADTTEGKERQTPESSSTYDFEDENKPEDKAPDAVDFSDITELAEEEENVRNIMAGPVTRHSVDSDDDYDEDESEKSNQDSALMPPPPAPLPSKGQDQLEGESSLQTSKGTKGLAEDDASTCISAPLSHIASMVMENQNGDTTNKRQKWDVSELFPDFKTGKVCTPAFASGRVIVRLLHKLYRSRIGTSVLVSFFE